MGGFAHDTEFNTLAMTLGNNVNVLLGCLLEACEKWWPPERKIEIPELLW